MNNAERVAGLRHGDDAQRKIGVCGTGRAKHTQPHVPVAKVQCDGHKIDGYFTILVRHPKGGWIKVVVERLWLILVIDVITRSVLGYHIALGRNYSLEDVLKAIRSAIVPWVPRQLTIPGLTYSVDSGMPSAVFPEMEWAIWGEIQVDGAMANRAQEVRDKITKTIGGIVNFGGPAAPEGRQIVERAFLSLEEASIHRLPNTTGSAPDDPRRNQPVEMAKKLGFTLDHLHDILAVTICNHNGLPTLGVGHRSPLQHLEYLIREVQAVVPQLPEEKRPSLEELEYRTKVVVRGSLAGGVRPYINFHNERYTNGVLSSGFHFLKSELTLCVNRDDISSIKAYLPNGQPLGMLMAQGIWRGIPHSLFARKAFDSLKRNRKLVACEQSDPITALMYHLTQEAPDNALAATKLAKIMETAKAVPIPEVPGQSNQQPEDVRTSSESQNVAEPARPRRVILL